MLAVPTVVVAVGVGDVQIVVGVEQAVLIATDGGVLVVGGKDVPVVVGVEEDVVLVIVAVVGGAQEEAQVDEAVLRVDVEDVPNPDETSVVRTDGFVELRSGVAEIHLNWCEKIGGPIGVVFVLALEDNRHAELSLKMKDAGVRDSPVPMYVVEGVGVDLGAVHVVMKSYVSEIGTPATHTLVARAQVDAAVGGIAAVVDGHTAVTVIGLGAAAGVAVVVGVAVRTETNVGAVLVHVVPTCIVGEEKEPVQDLLGAVWATESDLMGSGFDLVQRELGIFCRAVDAYHNFEVVKTEAVVADEPTIQVVPVRRNAVESICGLTIDLAVHVQVGARPDRVETVVNFADHENNVGQQVQVIDAIGRTVVETVVAAVAER